VLVVLRFAAGPDAAELLDQARSALEVLAACPGYEDGQLGQAFDDPSAWCLVTQWSSVGAYRRALGSYDVKLCATALLSRAVPEASAYEVLAAAGPGGPVRTTESDRAQPRSDR
jgi:antibiotic biosynthesis monooxygenase